MGQVGHARHIGPGKGLREVVFGQVLERKRGAYVTALRVSGHQLDFTRITLGTTATTTDSGLYETRGYEHDESFLPQHLLAKV